MEPPRPPRPGQPGPVGPPAPHAPAGAHGAPGAPAAPGGQGAQAVVAHEEHPDRTRTYVAIFVVLFVFTALEVAVTYFPEIPQAPTLITLAAVKFTLIAGFYMHLRYDSRVFSAFFMLGLILAAGMLFSFLALFTAHYREPITPKTEQAAATPGAGGSAAATATPGR
jgi:cytochrome c oxidase subunit IV